MPALIAPFAIPAPNVASLYRCLIRKALAAGGGRPTKLTENFNVAMMDVVNPRKMPSSTPPRAKRLVSNYVGPTHRSYKR